MNTVRSSFLSFRQWPLWYCGFRPFFLASALLAVFGMLAWGLMLGGSIPAVSWIAPHELHGFYLLQGVMLAAAAGFLLTALPVFTKSGPIPRWLLYSLCCSWLLAKLLLWLPSPWLYLALLCELIFMLLLLGLCAQRVLFRHSPHRDFFYVLAMLTMILMLIIHAWLQGSSLTPFLRLHAAALVLLVLIALARVSMRMVNAALQDAAKPADFLARPPFRYLLGWCIGLAALAEFFETSLAVQGYLYLACCAALLNLLQDWRLGWVLLKPYILLLFLTYLSLLAGYALMAHAAFTGDNLSAGRHLVMIAGLGLPLLAVLLIAGRSHAGLTLDRRRWIWFAMLALLLAAIGRLLGSWQGELWWYQLSALSWCFTFALYLFYFSPVLLGGRADGKEDCSGV